MRDKEVPKKTTTRRLLPSFRDRGTVCDRKHVRQRAVLTGETLSNIKKTLQNNQPVLLY